ncbi:MAG TPA: hypothetical protein VIN35_02250, partial [Hydrogenophaga sp.]
SATTPLPTEKGFFQTCPTLARYRPENPEISRPSPFLYLTSGQLLDKIWHIAIHFVVANWEIVLHFSANPKTASFSLKPNGQKKERLMRSSS